METSSDLFDSEFPTARWRTSEDALVEISAYAKNPYTGGGAWGAQFQAEALGGRDFNPELKESIQLCDAGSAARAVALQTAKRVLLIRAK